MVTLPPALVGRTPPHPPTPPVGRKEDSRSEAWGACRGQRHGKGSHLWCLFIGREQGMCHGCAYMRPGWDLEACCFWPFLEHSSCDPPPQVAESEVSTGPLYGSYQEYYSSSNYWGREPLRVTSPKAAQTTLPLLASLGASCRIRRAALSSRECPVRRRTAVIAGAAQPTERTCV